MKVGLMIGYSGAKYQLPMDLILEAETAGFDSVWSAEGCVVLIQWTRPVEFLDEPSTEDSR